MDVLLYYYDTASHTTSWILLLGCFNSSLAMPVCPLSVARMRGVFPLYISFSIHAGSSFNKLEVLQLP